MNATWLIVDQASSRLMSSWAKAAAAAPSMVMQAITAAVSSAPGAASNSGRSRATRNTPAATMVAAWIRAETGVGPSIASGSQVCSGNWADLPQTPASSRKAAAVTVNPDSSPADAWASRSLIEVVPAPVSSTTTASSTPRSPTRVTRKAFTAARRAESRSEWWPTSRYEQAPITSQPISSRTRSSAWTTSIIAAVNSETVAA
jgi:hypothetical protein